MLPPAGNDLHACALIGIKVTEQYPLTDDEREKLVPSIKSWDISTLHDFMCWEQDKLGIFGTNPVFYDFRLIENGENFNFEPLFLAPDEETTYCVVTNGQDSGVVMTWDHDKWYILACVGVYDILGKLTERGFLSWSVFNSEPRIVPSVATTNTLQEPESDDDYWNQYDSTEQQIEDPQDESLPLKRSNTRIFIKSHLMNTVRDMYMLYEAANLSTDQYANDMFASVAPMYRGCVLSSSHLGQYVQRVVQNELRLYEQVELDLDVFLADLEVTLLELDFKVLAKLG